MIQTLVIYDETGYVLSTRSGEPAPREPIGVPFLWVDIPKGKQLKITGGTGVDVRKTPHEVVLEDIPKSEVELLKEQLTATQQAVDFLLTGGSI